jgi:hypothetical protein
LALYSGLDTLTLFEIRESIDQLLTPASRAIYEFELKLQAPLLEMSFAGLLVDHSERERLTREHEAELHKVEKILHELCLASGYYDWYLEQAIAKFYSTCGINPNELPRSWPEWVSTSIQWRRMMKANFPEPLAAYQKALRSFGPPYIIGDETSAAFNGASPAQKLRLFYDFFGHEGNSAAQPGPHLFNKSHGIDEIKSRNSKGDFAPAADRAALEKLLERGNNAMEKDAAYWARPFVQCCLEIADLSKTLGFLKCKLERGYFKYSYGTTTTTGRLSSRENAQGFGCFPVGTAQVLTETGWLPIEAVVSGTRILQWTGNRLEWAAAEPYKTYFSGDLQTFTGKRMQCSVTPDHRLACRTRAGFFYEAPANTVFTKAKEADLIISGAFTQGKNTIPRLVVALLADGCLVYPKTRYWRVNLKKPRKLIRFRLLCQEAHIEYKEVESPAGYTQFYLKTPLDWPLDWGVWVTNLTASCMTSLLDELAYWDGTAHKTATTFYTAKLHRAVWIQTLAHIAQRSASIGQYENTGGFSKLGSYQYQVYIKHKTVVRVAKVRTRQVAYQGEVYCVTVPSSFFLVKQFGQIFVSGNSNSQNVTPRLRTILCTEPGYKFAALDYSQIESRIVGAICFRLFGAEDYLNVGECGDQHTFCCSLVWPDLPWPSEFTFDYIRKYGAFPNDILKAAKALVDKDKFYRDFTRRDLVKRLSHGTNYYGQARHMAKQTHIDLALVQHFQSAYFAAFPEIKKWHRWIAEQVQTTGEITTMLGRPRKFFGRPTDDATLREAIAYEPQSVCADYTNTALLHLYQQQIARTLPIYLCLQRHDDITFKFLEPDEQQVVPAAQAIMEQHITLTGPSGSRNWFVPAEAKVGWNLGYKSPKNPDGLSAFPDVRTRTTLNPNDLLKRRIS